MKLTISKVVRDISQAMSIKFNMMVYDLQRRGKDIIVLSLGEAFFKIPLFSFKKLKNWEKGYHYSSSLGVPDLRKKISELYLREYGLISDPEKEILISSGSKIVIHMVLMSILNTGDEAMIFEPAWVSYPEQVKLCYGTPIMVRCCEGMNNLEKYYSSKMKVIIINNPNNPSGKVYSKKELQELYDFAKKHNLYIISDEAYSDFVIEEPFYSMGLFDKNKERTIVVNSLSKNLGMSGWRIGYMIASENFIKQTLKVNQHLITCPATLIEYYLVDHLDKILAITKPQIKAVVKKRAKVKKMIEETGLQCLPGTGTFYFLVSISGSKLNSEEFAERLLNEYHISTVPGIGYGNSVDRFLRIGVGTESLKRIQKGLDAIRDLIGETRIKLQADDLRGIEKLVLRSMHKITPQTQAMDNDELLDLQYLDAGIIDSLQFVQFLTCLEKDLKIKFSADQLESKKFRTLRGVAELINRKLKI